jgi:hypothetical protein
MRRSRLLATGAVAALAAVVVTAAALAGTGAMPDSKAQTTNPHATHVHLIAGGTGAKAANLRVGLNRLLGEHALLAVAATQAGYSGQKSFRALAQALDRNSVETANAIGSVYGTAARNKFLNGKLLWRDHIRFFVDYTVGLATKNKARQNRAVGNLRGYIEAFSAFLSTATGLPKSALRASITEHVMHLKGSIDAYAKGQYTRSYTLSRTAYRHMGMTGDVLAGAIVKKFAKKFT